MAGSWPPAPPTGRRSSGTPPARRRPGSSRQLPSRHRPVRAISISPDGRTLIDAGYNQTATFWDITDPTAPRRLASRRGPNGIYNAAFSPDGSIWATAEEGRKSTLWDVTDPAHPERLAILSGNASSVYAVGFDRTGTLLATGGFDKTVILWDVTDPRQPQRLLALPDSRTAVGAAVFLPDRDALVVGNGPGAVVWDVTRVAEIVADPGEVACDVLLEGLGPEEWEDHAPEIPYRRTCPPGVAQGQG